MIAGLIAAAAIVVFVAAHEAGHFFAAKAVGMKATEFFFGFGPKLWSTQRGETEYGLKALPLGGYVRIVGMNLAEEVAAEDLGRTYREKKFWEKSVVVLAGVGMNYLIAVALFSVVFATQGSIVPTPVVAEIVPTVAGTEVEIPTPAAEAGIRVGDDIRAIGEYPVTEWSEVEAALAELGPGPTEVTVVRSGTPVELEVVLADAGDGGGFLGVRPSWATSNLGVFESVGLAGQEVWRGIEITLETLGEMVKPSSLLQYLAVFGGDVNVDQEIRPVSPIGLVNIGSQVDDVGRFLTILASVNVILATLNLLPLYPLDGGHFAVALYEKVRGRRVDIRTLVPIAAGVIGVFMFLEAVAIVCPARYSDRKGTALRVRVLDAVARGFAPGFRVFASRCRSYQRELSRQLLRAHRFHPRRRQPDQPAVGAGSPIASSSLSL